MGNCLTTKLTGTINADLPKLGEMVINVETASQITGCALSGGNEKELTLLSSSPIIVSGYDNPGTEFHFNNYRSITLPIGKYTLKISPKYDISSLYLKGQNALTMVSRDDLSWVKSTLSVVAAPSITGKTFAFMKGALATNINCTQNGIVDTLENFAAYHSDITTLTTLTAYNNSITGSLDDFITAATSLKSIWITGGVTGALENVRKDFTVLKLAESQITGSLEDIGDITTLTDLSLFSSRQVTGDLSDLSGLTNLTAISLGYQANITGVISSLGTLTKLTSLSMTIMANVSGALEDMLDAMVTAGRDSGQLTVSALPSACTYNGSTFSGTKKFDFSSSGWAEHVG